jgi:hypothetical protein
VAWTEEPEVALVQRSQLGLVQPLDQRQHGRVHKADIGVGVAVAQLTNPAIVLRLQICNDLGSVHDVVEERHQHASVQPGMDPVVHLDEHCCR